MVNTTVFLPNGMVMGYDKPELRNTAPCPLSSLGSSIPLQEVEELIAARPLLPLTPPTAAIGVMNSLDKKTNQWLNTIPPYNVEPKPNESSLVPPALSSRPDPFGYAEKYSNPYAQQRPRRPVLDRVPQVPVPTEAELKKKVSVDPRWGSKAAWNSADLLARQKSLVTHCSDVTLLFEAVRSIVCRVLTCIPQSVKYEDLDFNANFGSSIIDNTRRISVIVNEPIELKCQIIVSLVDGQLRWKAEVTAVEDTPLTIGGRLVDLAKVNGDIPMDSIGIVKDRAVDETDVVPASKDRNRRKVKL